MDIDEDKLSIWLIMPLINYMHITTLLNSGYIYIYMIVIFMIFFACCLYLYQFTYQLIQISIEDDQIYKIKISGLI